MSNESTVKPKIEAKMLHVSTYKIKTALSSLEHYIAFDELRGGDSVISNFTNYIEAQPALARIAELEAQNHRQVIMISQLADECNSKDVTIAKLKACAEFYANKDNYSLVDEGRDYQSDYKCYELNETTYADEALGTKARTTLAEVAEPEQKVRGRSD